VAAAHAANVSIIALFIARFDILSARIARALRAERRFWRRFATAPVHFCLFGETVKETAPYEGAESAVAQKGYRACTAVTLFDAIRNDVSNVSKALKFHDIRGTWNIPHCVSVLLFKCNNGDCHGSRITPLADWDSDSNHFADLALRRVTRISARQLAIYPTPPRTTYRVQQSRLVNHRFSSLPYLRSIAVGVRKQAL
jgi:hypothetical protein